MVSYASCFAARLDTVFFYFNDTPTTEIYTLSLHDALPIFKECREKDLTYQAPLSMTVRFVNKDTGEIREQTVFMGDRKSTRLNSSHANISYAVFCLKKKKNTRPEVCECRS